MKTMKRVWISSVILLAAGCGVFGAEQAVQKLKFHNEAGWSWHINPAAFSQGSMASRGVLMRLDELKGEKLLLTLAYTEEFVRDVVRFRPVAFNASGQRFEFALDAGGGEGGAVLSGFVFDLKNLPKDQVKSIGLEKLTKAGLRDVIAPAALRKLRDAGANALPFPRLGERYDFELTTIEGKKIRSSDMQGKVVLLDFWAKWCGPCMAKLPKLKETYQDLHERGFEIIGLNHDYAVEQAKRTIAEQKLPWPNVLAPVDKDQRALWFSATGTGPLPRLLLIDRDGILRADVSPHDLQVEIDKLMGKK